MFLPFLQKLVVSLRNTPLHPQWLVFKHESRNLKNIAKISNGLIVDIGSGTRKIQKYLPDNNQYYALDYPDTAINWYRTKPDIFADAQQLPITSKAADTVLLLDVLEHLPAPENSLKEISRILKPGGRLFMQVPFLYPIHDAPLDFQRWTKYQLDAQCIRHGFTLEQIRYIGEPTETAALLTNIALSKTMLNLISHRSPLTILVLFIPLLLPLVNIAGWLGTKLGPADEFMPHGYKLICRKK